MTRAAAEPASQALMVGLGPLGLVRTGRVERYDADAGLGVIAEESTRYPFHCTAIADGTRRIAQGTEVYFLLRPALLGRLEAVELVPVQLLETARPQPSSEPRSSSSSEAAELTPA